MAHRIDDGHRHKRLEVADVQALLRLCNALHANGEEPDDRKRKLLHALRKLIGADRAFASVVSFKKDDGVGQANGNGVSGAAATPDATPAEVVSVVHAGNGTPGGLLASDASAVAHDPIPWHVFQARQKTRRISKKRRRGSTGVNAGSAHAADLVARAWCVSASAPTTGADSQGRAAKRRRSGGGSGGKAQFVHSFLPLADDGVVACLTVGRNPGRPRFSSRDRSIVCTLHPEVAWIYRTDIMLVSADARALSPRVRETLTLLLAGKGEKQIAAAMGLSYNTIHHYVKLLHRHFDVNSRSELLARWVGR